MVQSIKEKVKELEQQNRLFTGNLVDAIWVVDADTLHYEYLTPSIQRISGYTAEELTGTSITDRLKPDSLKHSAELLTRAMRDYERGQPVMRCAELELQHKNGKSYWVEIRAKFLAEADNRLKIVGISREITTQKKAEQQLERMNKKLFDALADKEKLLREIKVLRGLLPVCSGCKRIRDEKGRWWPLDAYISRHTDSDFTHTICPDCKDVFYPDAEE